MQKPNPPNIRTRINPSGKKVYFIDYTDPHSGKRIRETIGSRKSDAEKRKLQIYNNLMAVYLGEPEEPMGTKLFRNLLSSFMKNKENHISKGSLKRYMIYMNNFLEFMDNKFPSIISIKDLHKEYVVEYLNHRLRIGKGIKTVNGELGFIKSFFNYAVNVYGVRISWTIWVQKLRCGLTM